MFAPQPIVMRYGQGGLFSAAANLASAESAANEQRHQQEVQLEQQRLQQQQDQFNQQQAMEQAKLRLAQSVAQSRIDRTPTPSTFAAKQSLLAETAPSQKALIYKSGTTGVKLDPNVDQALQQALNDPNITATMYKAIVNGAVKKATPPAAKTVSPTTAFAAQIQNLDRQSKTVQDHMKNVSATMADKGHSPLDSPAQFNPQYGNPNGAAMFSMGPVDAIQDVWHGGEQLVSGGDPDAMKQMLLYYGLKNQYDQLQAQRQQMIQNAMGQQMQVEKHQSDMQQAKQQAAPPGPVRVETDDDYNALPSGATFIDPQGNVRRKP